MAVILILFKEDFALTFLNQKPNIDFALEAAVQSWTRLQEFGFYVSYLWAGLQDDVTKYKPP